MKKIAIPVAVLTLAGSGLAVASEPRDPASAKTSSSTVVVVVRPTVFQTYGDAYNTGFAHFLIGTSAFDPGTGITCLGDTKKVCAPVARTTLIARAAYIGSIDDAANLHNIPNTDINDLGAFFVFDASKLNADANLTMRFSNVQNFVGAPYTLAVKILENRGDKAADPGAEGIFNRPNSTLSDPTTSGLGPFGQPAPFVIATALADSRNERADKHVGGRTMPGGGPLVAHDNTGGKQPPYFTFDRSVEIPLCGSDCVGASCSANTNRVRNAILAAQSAGVAYKTCKYSCIGGGASTPATRNRECTIDVANPLYVGITGVIGEGSAGIRLQDVLAVDNIIHLMGDCDFAGEPAPGTTTFVEIVSNVCGS